MLQYFYWCLRVICAVVATLLFVLGNWNIGFPISIFAAILLCISVWKAPGWWGGVAGFTCFASMLIIFLLPGEKQEMNIWIPEAVQFGMPCILGMIYSFVFSALAILSTKMRPLPLSFLFGAAMGGCDFCIARFTLVGIGVSPSLSMDVNILMSGWAYLGGFVGITSSMFTFSAATASLFHPDTSSGDRKRIGIACVAFLGIGISGIFFMESPKPVPQGGIIPQTRFAPQETQASVVVLPEGTSEFAGSYNSFEKTKGSKEDIFVSYQCQKLGVMLIECPWGKRESFCLVFDRDGKYAGFYEKNYPLWQRPTTRCKYYLKDTSLGKMGIAICFDALHLSIFPEYARLGVQIMVWPCYDGNGWPARRHIRIARLWALCSGMMIVRSADFASGAYHGISSLPPDSVGGFVPSANRIIPGIYTFPWLGYAGLIACILLLILAIRTERYYNTKN